MNQYFIEKYKFCPSCKNELTLKNGALCCSSCGFCKYNNPSSCVTIIVVQDGKILLGKRAIEPQKDYWDSPGGFIDSGETAAEAIHREMKEETNLDIEIIDFFGTIADTYAGAPTIALNYEVKIIGGKMKAQDDVAELKWFDLNDLPAKIAFENTKQALEMAKKKYILDPEFFKKNSAGMKDTAYAK